MTIVRNILNLQVIIKASAENLGLTAGKQVYAVIKSSDVMIAVD
ncbi:TOBE domain-containing protein [Planktothrix sp. FACHB-1355]|uniref:TOBE domain-containing protein n=1 Tax=Aerosakkonema funiforme FACHB-1375 TaxID=2949571 RepID=A0A926VKL8_9CYAN|nr:MULTISPECIES: TOBE domain-containing protein [Oscillatoriales]MBD2185665.1 TOBE domain-containing protein [Aerosakkonema funiforme FACHB-1375]MBD3557710.1 TOBE domain-containing protein [Planktothrix sp. FACHB-1355]